MKNTKIKKIPMFKTKEFDREQSKWIFYDHLSHADYEGQIEYSSERDELGRAKKIDPTYIDNIPWKDTLRYEGYYRGRSAAGFTFRNDKGQIFSVFMKDIESFIPKMVNGNISGTFIYCKRGKNYGVTLYEGEV